MRIGLDIDGVMYQWDKTARYMLRNVLPNSPYKGCLRDESPSWDFIEKSVQPEHWRWLWTEGVRLGLFRHGHLYPGTIEAVRRLAELGDVIVITHRPKSAVHDTLDWLAYQRLPISGVHLLTNGEPKSDVRPHCDIYLDDRLENVSELVAARAGIVCLRMQPWNKTRPREHTYDPIPVPGWDEFIHIVEEECRRRARTV